MKPKEQRTANKRRRKAINHPTPRMKRRRTLAGKN